MNKRSLDLAIIYSLKKQLCHALINNNYDLQSTEILELSKQLDNVMVPLFKEQLNSYKPIHPLYK